MVSPFELFICLCISLFIDDSRLHMSSHHCNYDIVYFDSQLSVFKAYSCPISNIFYPFGYQYCTFLDE